MQGVLPEDRASQPLLNFIPNPEDPLRAEESPVQRWAGLAGSEHRKGYQMKEGSSSQPGTEDPGGAAHTE